MGKCIVLIWGPAVGRGRRGMRCLIMFWGLGGGCGGGVRGGEMGLHSKVRMSLWVGVMNE